MITTKEHWCCKDCGKDTYINNIDYYIVNHEIWEKFGVGSDMLCLNCIETRIGHKLTKKDLIDCFVNKFNPYTNSILYEKY